MDDITLNKITSKMKKNLTLTSTHKTFSELTTLGVGGKIKLVIYPDTVRKLIKAVKYLIRLKVRYVVLGKGSNTLASDYDFDGVVVSTLNVKGIKIRSKTVVAEAGASTITLAKLLQQRGLTGGEFLACLPASVGGAVVTNAGCFNQNIQSVVTSVTALVRGKIKKLPFGECRFSKRSSIFKNDADYVVLFAKFKFNCGNPDEIASATAQMKQQKAATQPLNCRSAGCMFYHDRIAISRLIDEANLKGYTVGGAKISAKHAGFVVNVDKAQSKDIYLIIRHVKQTLYNRYGIVAKVEVCPVNFTKDELDDIFAGSKK